MKEMDKAIGISLSKEHKIDHRSSIPINQCKVVALIGSEGGEKAEDKAKKEVEILGKRNEEKQKAHEEFMKKTKERVKAMKIKVKVNTPEKIPVDEENRPASFTFNDVEENREVNDKTAEFLQGEELKPKSNPKLHKKPEKISKPPKPQIEAQAKPQQPDSCFKVSIPRFVSVDDMKIQYHPKLIRKIDSRKPISNSKTQSGLSGLSPNLASPANKQNRPTSSTTPSAKSIEQSRFSVALKSMVSSKMSNLLSSPSICTCGSATGKMSSHPKKCANNCPFYKKEGEYQRALKEMLSSFKASE